MNNKIYLSGKITGLPIASVKCKFIEAEDKLIEKGFDVVNPLLNEISTEAWEVHLAKDLRLLMECSYIYMLHDWSISKGAILEKKFAELMGIKIIYEKEPNDFIFFREAIHSVGITYDELVSNKRDRNYVYARMIYAKICRDGGMYLKNIANELKRSHSTIIYYLHKYSDNYRYIKEFRNMADKIINAIEIKKIWMK